MLAWQCSILQTIQQQCMHVSTDLTPPPPMRALTSIKRGPLLVALSSTWNTPSLKPSSCSKTADGGTVSDTSKHNRVSLAHTTLLGQPLVRVVVVCFEQSLAKPMGRWVGGSASECCARRSWCVLRVVRSVVGPSTWPILYSQPHEMCGKRPDPGVTFFSLQRGRSFAGLGSDPANASMSLPQTSWADRK